MPATAIRTNYSNLIYRAATALTEWEQTGQLSPKGEADLREFADRLHCGLPVDETDPGDFHLQALLNAAWMSQPQGNNTFLQWCNQYRQAAKAIHELESRQYPEVSYMETLFELTSRLVTVVKPRPRPRR
jgi:hypothetical protein